MDFVSETHRRLYQILDTTKVTLLDQMISLDLIKGKEGSVSLRPEYTPDAVQAFKKMRMEVEMSIAQLNEKIQLIEKRILDEVDNNKQ